MAANNVFLEEHPAAAELFRQVRLPLAWICEVDEQIGKQDLTDADVRPLAAQWIADNRERVDAWLAAARAAAQ